MVQLSHLYMTTGKTTALNIRTCVSKMMSLLFNMLSRFVIAFFPRKKCHLNSWLWSPSSGFGAQENTVNVSTYSPSTCHEVMGLDAMILIF